MSIRNKLKGNKTIYALFQTYLYYKDKFLYRVSPRIPASLRYKRVFGKRLNWENPQDLIEKIAWMELYSDTELWTKCADKYRVREYIKEHGCGEFLPELYGCWENVDEIDFEDLPVSFVLKANNGCGTVRIVKDKSKIDVQKIRKELKSWLKKPYGYGGSQRHYLSIKPCIIAEELLPQDEICKKYSPNSQIDYKVWCINGEPQFFLITYNRKNFTLEMNCYDLNWNPHSEYIIENRHYLIGKNMIPCPKSFDTMISICRKLSSDFKEVRIDFYEVSGKPYIGEMTFSSGYGYFTDNFYQYLGSKIDIGK